ncbi:MAG: hypothetical protein OXK76_05500 [Gammaproteobacteria bacterium]|nr:hypothetical protein [Gammaproteobacteria bacterium]
MRAALAHVLGTVGIVGAFGAGAAPDDPYAAESLTGMAPYSIMGSPMGEIVLDVEIDTLLDTGTYYLAVNFWTAELTGELGLTYTETAPDTAGTAGDPVGTVMPTNMLMQPVIGKGTGFRFYTVTASVQGNPTATPPVTAVDGSISGPTAVPNSDVTLTRAYRGDEEESGGAYRMVVVGAGIPIDTRLRLDLSSNLAIRSKAAAGYRGDVYIYEELGDARAAVRASAPGDVPDNHLFSGHSALFRVASKIAAPTITPMLVTADVGYERAGDPENNVSTGGPFRGFTAPSPNVGVLATIALNEKMDNPATAMTDEGAFLAAATGLAFEGTVNTAARVVVTSTVDGAFGFGNGAGDKERRVTGDNPDTPAVETDYVLNAGGAPMAFRVGAVGATCGGTALTLSAPNADGDQVSINPLADTNPTFSAMANQGAATVSGGGPFQLCVNVSTNEVAIPAVGDDRMLDGYMMTVTPMSGPATGRSAGPAKSGAAGSIDRNGTTVNIAYLSTNLSYNQRLVIVNRGSRDADFWMDDFQTEEGISITGEISGTVKAGTRMVVRVQDMLDSSDEIGAPRASGTLNLTAREAAVSVMTIQENLGTGQLDTTMY